MPHHAVKAADSGDADKEHGLKHWILNAAKVGLSVALLAFLLIQGRDALGRLDGHPPNWGLLSLAAALCVLMVMTTIVRWYLLVRALELPFRMRDAFRLGFLGYMFNFVSLGSVGGDLFRAVFIAREQPGRRAEAVATVFIDRVIGLYALFIVATVAVLASGLMGHASASIRLLCRATLLCTALSTFGLFVVLTPGFTNGRLSLALGRLPYIGTTVQRLLGAVRIYRTKYPILLVTLLMSLGVHSFSTTGIYLAAQALPGEAPSLLAHFLIVPLGMLAAALPVSVSGVGVFEGAIELLYLRIPSQATVLPGTGTIVGLAYRALTIGIAIVGFGYYLANRAVVAQIIRQAQKDTGETLETDSAAPVSSSHVGAVNYGSSE